jgi:hypothetical protein
MYDFSNKIYVYTYVRKYAPIPKKNNEWKILHMLTSPNIINNLYALFFISEGKYW